MATALARKVATKVFTDDLGFTVVRYHDTDIVKVSENYIELNTGGWFTLTTKRRMNQVSSAYNLGFYVYQLNGSWYAKLDEVRYRFNGRKAVIKRGN
jgi:hypothetical protein